MDAATRERMGSCRRDYIESCALDHLKGGAIAAGAFSIVNIGQGAVSAAFLGKGRLRFDAPALLCLSELDRVRISSEPGAGVRVLRFDPRFLNIHMRTDLLRAPLYGELCRRHGFFPLSPFLTADPRRSCFSLNSDTQECFVRDFLGLSRNLAQEDRYWSCRARSYLIQILHTLEQLYHQYDLPPDTRAQIAKFEEFRALVAYINNHMEEKHTLDSLYARFRINKNQIEQYFRDYLHTSFSEYLRHRRFEDAANYLRFTELGSDIIAARIGLSSAQNFCKFFRHVTGMTPGRFRRETVSNRISDAVLCSLIRLAPDEPPQM